MSKGLPRHSSHYSTYTHTIYVAFCKEHGYRSVSEETEARLMEDFDTRVHEHCASFEIIPIDCYKEGY